MAQTILHSGEGNLPRTPHKSHNFVWDKLSSQSSSEVRLIVLSFNGGLLHKSRINCPTPRALLPVKNIVLSLLASQS